MLSSIPVVTRPLAALLILAAGGSRPVGAATTEFVRDVKPLLEGRCYKCHAGDQNKGGLRLDRRQSALEGGDSGKAALVPGSPAKSHLLELVRGTADGEFMPPKGKGERLTAAEVARLEQWITEGAPWPESADAGPATESAHWAFRRPVRPDAPAVRQFGWTRNGIDPFVLARMEGQGLAPAAEADPHTLIRRVSLDLTGLPPTPEEVRSFVSDRAPGAYERAVDRLLASPAYGERWARLWLDLARYADSKGYGSDPLRPYIWRYRDWVIDAFNRNLPYDQFTVEQLAGDLLPHPTDEQVLATAFHRNTMTNDEGGTDNEEFRVAAIKDRIDTTMQVWMGLTFGCAKCHSHKYDPISQREYYSFYAFFNQTADADLEDEAPRYPTPTREQRDRLDALRRQMEPLREEMEHPRQDLASAQRAWEEQALRAAADWSVLEPAQAQASGRTELYREAGNTLYAAGPNPDSSTYTLEFPRLPRGVTAFQLELRPVEGSGRRQIGRGRSGGVSIHEIRAVVQPASPRSPYARYVRVELPGKDRFLSLAEVQVFSGGTNAATAGKASQSSTDFEGEAGRANDGNTSGDYNAGSVTHTRLSESPWWEVDLGAEIPVQRVAVWNRTGNGLEERLKGYRVVLLDARRSNVVMHAGAPTPAPSTTIELNGDRFIPLVRASGSVDERGSGAALAVDGDPGTAWTVNRGTSRTQVAVFQTAAPVTLEPGERLVFSIVQSGGDQSCAARVRLLATTSTNAMPALPYEVADALQAPAAARTPDQARRLARHFWMQTPEYAALRAKLTPLEEQSAAVEKQIVRTPVLQELPPDRRRVTRVLSKGNFLTPGDAVQPRTPASFHPFPEGAPTNRLGVAQWLMDPRNPLTARVAVNRFWSALFSRGLVESEEDFGTQGTAPSHPELLDWLATEFVRLRWDTKALLKLMVTSATYRQSAAATAAALQKDPRNVWLSRAPRPRLEAEMIRDQALALSGLLSRKLGGPSVYPPQPANLWQAAFNGERNWATSEGEDRHRRGLYTFWRRTVPYPSMLTFDAPTREYCTVRRVPSNTPLQAFVTLNDPVFVEAAQALAGRILREGGADAEARIRWALELVTCRPAADRQVAVLRQLLEQSLERFRGDAEAAKQMAPAGDGDVAERAAWSVLSNVLLNLDSVLTKG